VFDNSEAAVNIAEINGQPPAQFGGFIGDDTLHAAVDYVCQDGLPMRFESDFTRTDDPETYRFITTWNLLADVYGTRSWTVTGVSSQDIGRIAYFPAGVSIRGLSAPVSGTIDYTLTINEAETEYELYAAGAGAFVPANTQDRAAFYAYQKSELVGNEYQTSYWLNGFAKSGGVTFKLEPPLALEDSELPRITLTLGKNDTPIVASDCILGKLEIVVPDQNGDPVPSAEVPFSEPAPQVILGDISLNDVEIDGEVATVHISGEVFDPIADNFPRRPISYGGADIEEVAVFVDGAECSLHIPVTPDPAYEQAHKSFWRQHPFRGTFDTTIEIVGKDVKVLVVSTAPNVANYSAMDVAWLYFTPSYQEGPYVLEDVENQEGSEPGTYHPFLHRISAKVGRPEDCRFLHRGVETEVEEDDGYYYPKGGSKEVIVYVMIDKNDENARPLKKRPTEKRLRPYRITYEVTDEGLIYKKSDRVWKTYQCYLDAADCLFQTKSLYWYSQRIGSYRGLSSIHATLAAAESSTKPYSSLGCHMCPEANCLLSDLSGLFTMPGLGTIDWWLGCIMRSQWKVPGLEFLQLCMELPGNGAWQRLAFMIEHWEHVKPACELFAIPPEVFFATIFAEHSDNKWNSDLGERWNAHYLDFPKCTGFGLANLPENAASDGTWLGYNLHSPAYMQNPGVPEAVRTAYAALAPNDREARITAFYNNRQLSIWVHAARMRAIADTLADTQVGLNPDRFNRRIGENYDWSTKYIDDNVSLLSLANFVMLATEQTGFARIPLSWEVADRGMIDIPFGDHMEESTTVRENIGYVNVWKVFGDSLFPGDWQAEGGRKYNDGYGFCVEDVYSYNVSYKDAVFIFEVFKTSSVYRGE